MSNGFYTTEGNFEKKFKNDFCHVKLRNDFETQFMFDKCHK